MRATNDDYLKGMAYKWIPEKKSSSFIFKECGDFNLKISVWDEEGNTDYCIIALRINCSCISKQRLCWGQVLQE